MSLHQCWTRAAFALIVLSGAAFADVTVSHSNAPTDQLGAEMASLFGAEHQAVEALPDAKLTEIAIGPKVETSLKTNKRATPGIDEFAPTLEWLMAQPAPEGDEQWSCLREALYFEARGESIEGQMAVAEVILNRTESPLYPSTICGVVNQGGAANCQFSFMCDHKSEAMADPVAADIAGRIARAMIDGAPRLLTDGATNFHSINVNPAWARRFAETTEIGRHKFYRQP